MLGQADQELSELYFREMAVLIDVEAIEIFVNGLSELLLRISLLKLGGLNEL